MPNSTLIVRYEIKKRNRRISLSCYRSDEDIHDFTFVVSTKRLVDFKMRQIKSLDAVYGLDSFIAISDLTALMREEPLFKKLSNVAISRASKNKYKGTIYINPEMSNKDQKA